MTFYKQLHKTIISPFSDKITGWHTTKHLKFLSESQWWSKEELYDFQCIRLQSMINHAYNNTIYYHELFVKNDINPESIKRPEDLKQLPILSKEDFRSNFPERISAIGAIPKNSFLTTATSGSTGRQLIYYISKDAYGFINATALRGWNWMEFELGDKYFKISQNSRHSLLKKIQDQVNRCLLFTHEYNQEGSKAFIKEIDEFKPKILRSYPDPLLFLCNYIKDEKVGFPYLKGINTTGNILFDEIRQLITETFNVPVFDSYSCEGSAQVFECPTHSCYHVSDEYAITEIIDENGNEVRAGGSGRLITTDLWNFAAPFIRYDTKDKVVRGSKACSCGRHLSTITKIEGRDNDILITPDKQFLIAQTFTTFFKYFEEIEQFQVEQNKVDSLIFRLIVTDNYNDIIAKKVIDHWRTYTNNTMKIEIEIVENIDPFKSGKARFLIRNPDISLMS